MIKIVVENDGKAKFYCDTRNGVEAVGQVIVGIKTVYNALYDKNEELGDLFEDILFNDIGYICRDGNNFIKTKLEESQESVEMLDSLLKDIDTLEQILKRAQEKRKKDGDES